MITRSRDPGPTGVAHGGISIMSRIEDSSMKEIAFPNPESFEVMAVQISVQNVERKINVISAYLPPGYTVTRGRAGLQHINDLILHLKGVSPESYFVLGGDFNQWEAHTSVEDYPDIVEALSPPTRNNRVIDRVFLNLEHENAACFAPLETERDEDGISLSSDHRVQLVKASISKKPRPVWKKITFRPYNELAAENFLNAIKLEDWHNVLHASGSNAKAGAFQSVLDELMDRFFPYKTIRKKDDDLPWLNETARKKIKRKKACFKYESRSPRWYALRKDLTDYLETRRLKFLEE